MRSALSGLAIALSLSACADHAEIPAMDLALRVEIERGEVQFGEGFELTVVRIWNKSYEVAPFDPAQLAPLVLREVDSQTDEDATRLRETLRYRAFAFTLTDLEIPAPRFEARVPDATTPRLAVAEEIRLAVRPLVDPQAPGAIEAPEGPLDPPRADRSWIWITALLAALFLAIAFGWFRARPRSTPVPTIEPPLDPWRTWKNADAELAAIRARDSSDAEAWTRDQLELEATLRRYLSGQLAWPAASASREECEALAAGCSDWDEETRASLSEVLRTAEALKYAAAATSLRSREEQIDHAENFLTALGPTNGVEGRS